MLINHVYKYATMSLSNCCLILQFSYDNTTGEDCYIIQTNVAFFSNNELAPCVGVGNDEKSAWEDFINELESIEKNQYNCNLLLGSAFSAYEIKEILLPYKLTLIDNTGTRGMVYYRKNEGNLIILTSHGPIITKGNEILLELQTYESVIMSSKDLPSVAFLRENLFYPIFDSFCY